MKKIIILSLMFVLAWTVQAQVGISTDSSSPDPTAILDVKSNNKGILIPRLTADNITSISDPADGLQVYCTTDGKLYIFVASENRWREVAYGPGFIMPGFVCGGNLTVNHVAGAVAPVTKTVTYPTVTGVPGEPSKCWTLKNLGASLQPASVDDGTEAAAGWYWQFDHKQGYRHNDTTCLPAWTISLIDSSSNWDPSRDPCSIELGPEWRIPTNTEWNNVETADGGWINWTGPWNSPLKLHTAGSIYYSNGTISLRPGMGNYWSSTQKNSTYGWYLWFTATYCNTHMNLKSYGFSVRCIKD